MGAVRMEDDFQEVVQEEAEIEQHLPHEEESEEVFLLPESPDGFVKQQPADNRLLNESLKGGIFTKNVCAVYPVEYDYV